MASPTPRRALPALADSRWLRFAVFTALYFVQGLPLGLITTAFPAWLLVQGMDTARVATFASVTMLPWVLKMIAGPFMDRFAFPAMGVRRPWVLSAQALLALAATSLCFVSDPHADFLALLAACTVMNALAAIQDVAVDGMAVTVLRDDERGRALAFMIGGQVAGTAFTGAAGVALLNAHGIWAAGLLTAGMVATVGALSLLFRERPGERLLPWSAGAAHPDAPRPPASAPRLLRDVVRVVLLPMSALLIVVEISYRVLEGVPAVWWPELAVKSLGFTDQQYGNWIGTAGIVAALGGLVIGPVIDRFGTRRGITIGLWSNALLYGGLWFAQDALAIPSVAIGALFAAKLGMQWMFISTVSLFMNICSVRLAATQFAIYMAFANLGRSGGVKLYPELPGWFGPGGVFLFMAAGYVIAWAIFMGFDQRRHRQRLAELGEV